MSSQELTLAEDLKRKLTEHILLGLDIRKRNVSLESSEVIGYNAVADSLMNGFVEVISVEGLEDSFDDKIASMESLLSDIKGFIFKKKKVEKQIEKTDDELPFWKKQEWIENDLMKLVDGYKEDGREIKVAAKYAAVLSDIDSLARRLKADSAAYMMMLTEFEMDYSKQVKFINRVEKEFKPFIGSNDKVEEFEAVIKKLVASQPPQYIAKFKEPNKDFLGYGRRPFVVKGEFEYAPPAPTGSDKTIKSPTKKQLEEIAAQLVAMAEVLLEVGIMEDELVLGLDATDPPTRGYIGESDDIDDCINNAKFYHPIFEAGNNDLVENINKRIIHVIDAVVHYLKKL